MKNLTITSSFSKLEKLENILSQVAGVSIEITIRGEKKFTYGFEGRNPKAEEKIKNYFKGNGQFDLNEAGYDHECDYTVIYHNI